MIGGWGDKSSPRGQVIGVKILNFGISRYLLRILLMVIFQTKVEKGIVLGVSFNKFRYEYFFFILI